MTLLAGLIVALLAGLTGRRRAGLIALAAVGTYTVFVGADAPVVRAAIMATVFLLAGILGRRASAAPAIALAAAIMVAVSPRVITDLGFQLSFAATASLAVLVPPLRKRAVARLRIPAARTDISATLAHIALETSVITLAAVAATLPLIALHFRRISLVAIPANLLVAPFFPAIFLGSLLTGIAGVIDPALGDATGWMLAWLPLSWFVVVAETGADLPFASTEIRGFGLAHAILLYVPLITAAWWLQRPVGDPSPAPRSAPRRSPAALGMVPVASVLLALNLVVWSAVATGNDADLRVHALDVGQGDALLVIAPSGATLLVDGGPSGGALLREVARTLPRGDRSIDAVVATHPQADHITGLFSVLDRYSVGVLIVSPLNDRTDLGRRLREAASQHGVPVVVAEPGMLIDLGAGVRADILGPSEVGGGGRQINDAGVVLRLQYEHVAFLLAADLEAVGELALARTAWDLLADVLKVAHHGSRTSTMDLLLRRVQPSVAVISVGPGNGFGHPTAEVLDRLQNVLVLRTDQDGAITLRSNGTDLRYSTGR